MQLERVVGLAEEPAGLAVGHVPAAAAHQLGQDGERREVGLPASEVAHDRPDVRRVDAAGEESAGLHHLPAGVVDRRAAVVRRADQRELVGDPGEAGQDLGDLEARDLGGDRLERARGSRPGASGFMSQRSMLLGAPRLKIMMHERSSCPGLTAPAALRGHQLREREPDGSQAPTWRKSRRVTPSQVKARPLPVKVSMRGVLAVRRMPSQL